MQASTWSMGYAPAAGRLQPAAEGSPAGQRKVTFSGLGARNVAVTFRFPGSVWADSVELGGSFSVEAFPMTYSREDDEWQVTIVLLRGRTYHYWYVLDRHERCFDGDGTISTPSVEVAEAAPATRPLLLAAPR